MRPAKSLRLLTAALVALAGLAPAAAPAPTAAPPPFTITNAWVRAVPGADVAAAYMTLTNMGREPIKVTGVRSPLAGHAMIHETRVVNGVSSMRPHEPLVIAPGTSITFAPEGLHVMLHDLTQPLAIGSDVPLEILVEGGGRFSVTARVRPLSAE